MVNVEEIIKELRETREEIRLKEPKYYQSSIRSKYTKGTFTGYNVLRTHVDIHGKMLYNIRTIADKIDFNCLKEILATLSEDWARQWDTFGVKEYSKTCQKVSEAFRATKNKTECLQLWEEYWMLTNFLYDWIDGVPDWIGINQSIKSWLSK